MFVDACSTLQCESAALAAHAAAATAKPSLVQDLVELCLSCVSFLAAALPLPADRRPAHCSWRTAAQACTLLTLIPKLDAIPAWLRTADSASRAAALAAAAQLLQQLPLDQPPDGCSQHQHEMCVATTTTVLGNLCAALYSERTALGRLTSQQQRRVAAQLLGSLGKLRGLLCCLADAGSRGRQLAVLHAGCNQMRAACTLYQDADTEPHPLVASYADATAWCHAACEVLQCMPLVQQLHGAGEQEGLPARFATTAVKFALYAGQAVRSASLLPVPDDSVAAAANESLHVAVWQLHSRLAQVVHLMAADSNSIVRLEDAMQAGVLLPALAACLCAFKNLTYGEQRQAWEGAAVKGAR